MLSRSILFHVLGLLLAASATPVQASLADCSPVYVLRLYSNMNDGRPAVVVGNTPDGNVGSYWLYAPPSLPDRYYQQLYSTLLTAKTARAPVAVATDAPDGCSITTNPRYITSIEIRNPSSPGLAGEALMPPPKPGTF